MTIRLRMLLAVMTSVALLACASPGEGPSPLSPMSGPGAGGEKKPDAGRGTQKASAGIPAVVGLPPNPGVAAAYRIGPGDLLDIKVFQADELSSEERVNDAGSIALPLVGPVQVGGLTPIEAEAKIAKILGKSYLQNPQVNIFVKQYANQNVTVAGAVTKPGVFPLTGRTTLLQAVAMAQGVTNLANDKQVIIFRSHGGKGTKAYIVNLAKIEQGKLADPPLVADDRVVVPESGAAVFFDAITGTLKGFISFGAIH